MLVQLECIDCGNSWYASRDAVSVLTIDASDSKKTVGTAPWATAKFDTSVEKKLVSPRESETNIFMKKSESFSKSRKDDNNAEASRHAAA